MLHILFSVLLYAFTVLTVPISNTDSGQSPDITNGAMSTSGRWIVDANGHRFKFRCVNWPGHMETNIPEGLQHKSIDNITSWIAKNSFNCVRLSYSIDMALNQNVLVKDSFTAAAAATGAPLNDMMGLFNSAVQNNPFLATATIIQVFEQVIASLDKQGVKVILDNHVSKASWCCSHSDGNGFFDIPGIKRLFTSANTKYFNINDWLQGLQAMATFARGKANVVGMDLRNELRPLVAILDQGNWYYYIDQGAKMIHSAHPGLLLIIGGLTFAQDMSFLYHKALDQSAYPNKVVWEFHSYKWSHKEGFASSTDGSCQNLQKELGKEVGFVLKENEAYTGPLWLSEFGIGMTSPSAEEQNWMSCIVQYMTGNDADWSLWVISGSYYVRGGTINDDEAFGLLDAQWNDWRNPDFPASLGGMFQVAQGPRKELL